MAIEYIGSGGSEGTNFGQSGEKIGFYGLATPIVKPTIVVTATATATTALNEAGYKRIVTALVALGLVTQG
tara:strand:- start:382 stop:594 length:213 start_codon:yes stop_codon:yes gene_type:complete